MDVGWAVNSMAGVLLRVRRERFEMETYGGRPREDTEVGVMQAKEWQRLLAATRSKDRGMEGFFFILQKEPILLVP